MVLKWSSNSISTKQSWVEPNRERAVASGDAAAADFFGLQRWWHLGGDILFFKAHCIVLTRLEKKRERLPHNCNPVF